jgi:UDP-N-acetylmuramoylalanine--D-glutamate ligase
MIDLSYLKGKTVAVLGLGKTGLAAAQALTTSGVTVLAWDDNEAQRAAAKVTGIEIADLNTVDLSAISFLLLSPGIPHTFPAPHKNYQRH